MNLDWKIVESSQLRQVAFDNSNNELYICFKNGAIYKYLDVTQSEFDSFMSSESKGKHFAQHIKCKAFNKEV